MAVSTPQAVIELAKNLPLNNIPARLRCANCNQLALDAFKLPCCDQNICNDCQSTLPTTCPVCQHTPISADDCKPNKTLRLTIRAFLKSEERKREKEKALAAATPAVLEPAVIESSAPQANEPAVEVKDDQTDDNPRVDLTKKPTDEQQDLIAEDRAEPAKDDEHAIDKDEEESDDDNESNISIEIITEAPQETENAQEASEGATHNGNAGWNNQNSGQMFNGFGFNGMDWSQNGGFNSMMQMQANMMNGNWNQFPNMMGSLNSMINRLKSNPDGIGMNPMDMQAMMNSFGMQGMGMNGNMMNMDPNSGYGGWNNGQQMSNDFGNGNFYAGGGGYNQSRQGQYFQHHSKNNYQNRFQGHGSFQNRRGSGQPQLSQTVNQGNNVSDAKQSGSETQAGDLTKDDSKARRDGEGETPENGNDKSTVPRDVDEPSIDPNQTSGNDDSNAAAVEVAQNDYPSTEPYTYSQSTNQFDMNSNQFDSGYMQNQMNDDYSQGMNNGYGQGYQQNGFEYHGRGRGRGRGRYGFRGGFANRGGINQYQDNYQVITPVTPIGVGVEGAPTGPKAMREGLPNVGYRGRGGYNAGRGHHHSYSVATDQQSSVRTDKPSVPPTPSESETNRKVEPLEESEHPQSQSRPQSESNDKHRARSSSRSQEKRKSQTKRYRSSSRTSEHDDHDRDRQHRKHKLSRHQYGDERAAEETDNDRRYDRSRDLSRDRSVDSNPSKVRSSRRDKEKDRHHSSRSRKSSRERRKHRHRSQSPQREEAENGYGANGDADAGTPKRSRSDKYRDRERERERDRDRRHRDPEREGEDDRDKDRDKKRSRRDHRSASVESRDHPKSSRHHRNDRDRDSNNTTQTNHKFNKDEPRNDNDSIKIRGHARLTSTSSTHQQEVQLRPKPPSGPKAPPAGPKALLDKLAKAQRASHTPTGPSATSHRQSKAQSPPAPAIQSVAKPPAENGSTDPHTLEREARNRERMLKEKQRRQQLAGVSSSADRKRSFEDAIGDFAPPTEPKGDRDRDRDRRKRGRRAVNYKYEDEENDEARARRVENEREASRYS